MILTILCLMLVTFSASQETGEGTLRLFRNGSVDDKRDLNWRSGIVQVRTSEVWGNICAVNIGLQEAHAICRQLGFARASNNMPFSSASNSKNLETFGTDNSPTVINRISCQGAEITATQCNFNTNISPQCMDDDNDLVVRCSKPRKHSDNPSSFDTETLGNIRLRNGIYSNEGLLEVYCGEFWGTVCIDAFSDQAATLACAQLGYNSFYEFYSTPLPPVSSNIPIWYDTSLPFGNCSLPFEMDSDNCLTSCKACPVFDSGRPDSSTCDHSQDVYLLCEYDSEFPRIESSTETIQACQSLNEEGTGTEGTGTEGTGTEGTGTEGTRTEGTGTEGTGTGKTGVVGGTTTIEPSTITPTGRPNQISVSSTAIIGIVALICFTIIVIIVIICLFLLWKMRSKKKRIMSLQMVKISADSSDENLSTTRPNHYIKPPFLELKDISHDKLSDLLKPSLIEAENLKLLEKIGQGEFGIVYRGLLTTYEGNEANVTSVAVKTLKGSYSQKQTDELIVEAEKMIQFEHLNVLSLSGICVGLLESPCIVMPFMSNGSLLSYIRKEAADLTVSASSDEKLKLDTTKHILSMCLQVAKGMTYLTEHKFVHRDLAARNCMISADGVIKVADFGLAEDVYTKEYFKQDRNSDESVKLPLKWMALESIHYGKFSEKSDVWSFGVLCWEVFSVGKSPYPGMSPLEVVDMLDAGDRLSRPSNAACCDKSYSLILTCWEQSPDKRPHFFELVERIEKLLGPLADYVDFTSNFARKFSS